ncbi:MAG: energy transducer TonB [Nitrospirota bacterium]
MLRSPHFTLFVLASLGLHLLFLAAIYTLAGRAEPTLPQVTPVNIVDLPKNILERLPPVQARPAPQPFIPRVPPRPSPESARPESVPGPKHFGTSPDLALPRTMPPQGLPDGSDKGTKPTGKTGEGTPGIGKSDTGIHTPGRGPLPFLSQADIDEFARKGMPAKKPGEDSVTLDTDEFKFISYNRWLKIKVESVLRYPELAALSGLQGTLYIQFDIMKDGSLGNLEMLKTSGYKILDDEALRAIRSAAPFQTLPDEWHMERYTIRAAVLFYLSGAYIR